MKQVQTLQMIGLASLATASIAVGAPGTMAVAAAVGLYLLLPGRPQFAPGVLVVHATPPMRSCGLEPRRFNHFFASRDSRSPDGDSDGSSNGASNGSGGSSPLSYEEFTSGLGADEDEEISFLPPYMSGEVPADQSSDEPEDPPPQESPTLVELGEAERESSLAQPRHFALGTVAILRRLLEPVQVERILAEQRRSPRLRFGDVAMQLGLLSESQLQELLLAQQRGLFTHAEIREARDRIRAARGVRI